MIKVECNKYVINHTFVKDLTCKNLYFIVDILTNVLSQYVKNLWIEYHRIMFLASIIMCPICNRMNKLYRFRIDKLYAFFALPRNWSRLIKKGNNLRY